MHHADNLSWAGSVDKLVAAQAELFRLQQEELQLLKQLFDVRAAAKAQKIKIDVLIKERNRPTLDLPTELLVNIFYLCICPDTLERGIYRRRHQLASVSRHWRDIILCIPAFWTYLTISPNDISFLKTRLKRSRSAPLDIVVTGWGEPDNKTALIESIQIIAPCADRWRSLTMHDNYEPFAESVIDEINGLEFPFCRRVNINARSDVASNWLVTFPNFLLSKNSLALEHISLWDIMVPPGFLTLSKLTTLELTNVDLDLEAPAVSVFSQSLTKLSLFGTMLGWPEEPGFIRFPALRTLVLHVENPRPFLESILAPVLESFDYSYQSTLEADSVVFSRVENKFHAVHHLALSLGDELHWSNVTGVALRQAFPSVRYLKINANDMVHVFVHCQQSGLSRCIMDDCNSLEQVTICYADSNWKLDSMDLFVGWLTNRIRSGQKRLRVKLTGSFPPISESTFAKMRKCCILELEVSMPPLVHLSMSEHSPLRVVSASSFNIGIVN